MKKTMKSQSKLVFKKATISNLAEIGMKKNLVVGGIVCATGTDGVSCVNNCATIEFQCDKTNHRNPCDGLFDPPIDKY
ncbi:MAG: hypothetical protein GY765_16065 [bacterium]|nr:hypothetical protein [bacterium]